MRRAPLPKGSPVNAANHLASGSRNHLWEPNNRDHAGTTTEPQTEPRGTTPRSTSGTGPPTKGGDRVPAPDRVASIPSRENATMPPRALNRGASSGTASVNTDFCDVEHPWPTPIPTLGERRPVWGRGPKRDDALSGRAVPRGHRQSAPTWAPSGRRSIGAVSRATYEPQLSSHFRADATMPPARMQRGAPSLGLAPRRSLWSESHGAQEDRAGGTVSLEPKRCDPCTSATTPSGVVLERGRRPWTGATELLWARAERRSHAADSNVFLSSSQPDARHARVAFSR